MTKDILVCDTLIKNAMIFDGSGSEPYVSDVAIGGNKIIAIGNLDIHANIIIHANKLALAPGFIDVHTHDDFAVLCNRPIDFKVKQGITSIIVGNCGFGAAPFESVKSFAQPMHPYATLPNCKNYSDYVNVLMNKPPSVNVAFLVGHGTIRHAIMGNDNRKPTLAELNRMCDLLYEGMDSGALGFSSGLIYEPGRYAETDELIYLAKSIRDCGGLYATHMRNEADKLLDSINESIRIGMEAGVPVQISHHKVAGRNNWGLVNKSLSLIDKARASGLDITADQYPYTSGSTILSSVLKNGALGDCSDGPMGHMDARDVLISSAPTALELEGKTLYDLCQEWHIDPERAAEKILEKGEVFVVLNAMDPLDVCSVMKHSTTMIGSDGIPSDTGNPHPRLYGTFAKVLGYYVRDEKVFSLSEAIHRMTGFPATKFKIQGRGFIRENYFADLVLFDPNTINDIATYSSPRQYPLGIKDVFVNGSAVVKDGIINSCFPGNVIKRFNTDYYKSFKKVS